LFFVAVFTSWVHVSENGEGFALFVGKIAP